MFAPLFNFIHVLLFNALNYFWFLLLSAFRAAKVLKEARATDTDVIGMSFDAALGITIFIGFVPQTSRVWDLPPLMKKALPDIRGDIEGVGGGDENEDPFAGNAEKPN